MIGCQKPHKRVLKGKIVIRWKTLKEESSKLKKLLENCSLRREEAKEPTKANQSIWKCEEAIFLKPRNNKNRGKLANYNSTELQNADVQKA